jgi:hypothetical protein
VGSAGIEPIAAAATSNSAGVRDYTLIYDDTRTCCTGLLYARIGVSLSR